MGMGFDDIEKLYIAGGFGRYIDVERAITIGMLPDLPVEKFQFLGNTSIMGAYYALLCDRLRHEAEEIAKKMTYVELSCLAELHGRVHVGAVPAAHEPGSVPDGEAPDAEGEDLVPAGIEQEHSTLLPIKKAVR